MSWNRVKLGNIATFVNGYAFKPSDWSDNGLEIIRIQNLTKGSSETNYFNGKIPEKYKVIKGDILISWSATLDIFVWGGNDAWLNQHIFKVVFDKVEIDKQYFIYSIQHILDDMRREVHGATMKHITKGNFDNLEIPLPPLETQKRIAEILDSADALKRKDQELLKKYDELAQVIFIDMFGDPVKNEKGWEIEEFGNYISVLTDYHSNGSYETLREHVTLKNTPDYALMVRTTDLEKNDFTKNVNYISKEAYEHLDKSKVFGGEIIINKIGSAGKIYLMPFLNRPVSLGMNTFLVRLNKNLDTVFTYHFLNSDFGKYEINKRVFGAVTKTITKEAVRSIPIYKIPIELQLKYVNCVKVINALANRDNYNKSELLFDSLIQKAFKGELVV